jgi:hypothetical protein
VSKAKLQALRDELAAIGDPLDWSGTIAVWTAKARPLIRSAYPDHGKDFDDVVKMPRWVVSPRFASSRGDNFARAAASDKSANTSIAQKAQKQILSFVDGLLALDPDPPETLDSVPAAAAVAPLAEIDWLLNILRRFDVTARALKDRPRADKKTLGYAIADEYDVQDLLFAILKPVCDDLEREDPVPKTAGDSGRVDLSSRLLGTVIEIKCAKDEARARAIARECKERVVTYSRWPDLKHLVFFVYDPGRRLPDADNFIRGLTIPVCQVGGAPFSVTSVVSPWQVGVLPGASAIRLAAGELVSPPEAVDTAKDPSAGAEDAFVVALGQPVHSRDYKAVMVPASLTNRSDRPNSVERVLLTIGGEDFEPTVPPPNLQAEGRDWYPSSGVRVESWATSRGAWFFGRGLSGGSPVELTGRTVAVVRIVPVRGATVEAEVEIIPLSELQGSQ